MIGVSKADLKVSNIILHCKVFTNNARVDVREGMMRGYIFLGVGECSRLVEI